MIDDDVQRRYSAGAMFFHWVIAIAVIWNWRLAENAHHAADRTERMAIFADHKALGITILVLTLARLAWRIGHPAPPMPAEMAAWEKAVAKTTHVIFYVLLIGLPVGAWLANSMAGRDIDFFGLFTIPPLPVGENGGLAETIFGIHGTAGGLMIWLIGLHILGALKHTFFDKRGGLSRMLPFGKA